MYASAVVIVPVPDTALLPEPNRTLPPRAITLPLPEMVLWSNSMALPPLENSVTFPPPP